MARAEFLPFSRPFLSEAEVESVTGVLRASMWLSSGPKTKEFEEAFRARVQAEAVLAVNSCTAALHLAMVAHGVGPGDEVISTPITFCATTNMVEHVGGHLVLADIDPETLLIDPVEIEKRITKKTKVLLPVHFCGHPCDMDRINALAAAHPGVAVVEDAAHCMPSLVGDRPVGAGSNLATFSFYPTKNMTTGEGGMLTGARELVDRAREFALHGMSRSAWDRFKKGGSWKYDIVHPGFKYNLTDVASAIGLVQLRRLDELYERRLQIVNFYEESFKGNPYLVPLKTRTGFQSSRHMYIVQLNLPKLSIDRDEFVVQMNERNIGCTVHYPPIHMFTHYAKKYGWKPESFPKAHAAFQRIVSLPLCSAMTLKDAEDVVTTLAEVCAKFQR